MKTQLLLVVSPFWLDCGVLRIGRYCFFDHGWPATPL
jgi:hypothetical protein